MQRNGSSLKNLARSSEAPAGATNGYAMVGLAVLLFAAIAWLIASRMVASTIGVLLTAVLLVAAVLVLVGLYMLQPNESAVLTLFGKYTGTDRGQGLRWANPLAVKHKVSLRARNLNAPTLKVNDKRGNPIEISAVIVWRVSDTAQAEFDVDDIDAYVKAQAEAAIRHLASQYAYDEGDDVPSNEPTLRSSFDAVGASLARELQERFDHAGVDVIEARISHLAYAQEIAQVMLRRQQAEAVVSARHKIVQGAVGMVEAALRGLSERNVVELDDERRAAMVSNLLVVLCADREVQPVVNAGTLYNG